MRERKIGQSIILQTVQNPEDINTDRYKGKILSRKFGNKILMVPILEQGNDIIVKSVYFKK